MRRRPGRSLLALLVPVLVAGVITVHERGADPSPRRNTGQTGGSSAAPARSDAARRPLTLLTGDQVRLTTGPGGRSIVTPATDRPNGSLAFTFRVGGDIYSIPGAALPYVGKVIDPRFFDLSYLQRAGFGGLNAIPVVLSWRNPRHTPVPGIRAAASGRTTTGSVSLATAKTFGAALTKHTSAIAQLAKISLGAPASAQQPNGVAGAPGPAPALPMSVNAASAGTPLHTLRIRTLDHDGNPAAALVAVQDLKSVNGFHSISAVADGELDLTVPAGSYGVEAFTYDNGEGNFPRNPAFVPVTQVDVKDDSEITLDGRQAREIKVSVPQGAATTAIATMTFTRSSADHSSLEAGLSVYGPGISSSILPPVHLYATPTPAPRLGSLGFADSWELVPADSGLSGVDAPYAYSLDFASDSGVPAALSHILTAKDLAVDHERYATSVPAAAAFAAAAPMHSWSTLGLGLFPAFFSFPVPTRRDDYFGGAAGTVWIQQSQIVDDPEPSLVAPTTWGANHTFRPGDEITTTWGAGVSVPAPEWQTQGLPAGSIAHGGGAEKATWSYVCPVCRQGDLLAFNVTGSGDDDPTHSQNWMGLGAHAVSRADGGPTDQVKFYRNGVLTQFADASGQVFPMLPGRASYAVEWDSSLPVAWTQLGTHVHSVWRFHSTRPTKNDALPRYELCAPDVNQGCSYVPLIFATCDFGASLDGRVSAPGAETFTVRAYREPGATGPAFTKATAQISFDDGTTWVAAAGVKPTGDGRFQVSVNQPAPSTTSGYASVRVTVTDAAGDSLEQTIGRAYALRAASATHR